jgi:hypothetical protein
MRNRPGADTKILAAQSTAEHWLVTWRLVQIARSPVRSKIVNKVLRRCLRSDIRNLKVCQTRYFGE